MRRMSIRLATGVVLVLGGIALAATVSQPTNFLFSALEDNGASSNVTYPNLGTTSETVELNNIDFADGVWVRATTSERGLDQPWADREKPTATDGTTAWSGTDGCLADTLSAGYTANSQLRQGLILINNQEFRIGPDARDNGVGQGTLPSATLLPPPTGQTPSAIRFLTGAAYGTTGTDTYTVHWEYSGATTDVDVVVTIKDESTNGDTIAERAGSGTSPTWNVTTSNNGSTPTLHAQDDSPACTGYIDVVTVPNPTPAGNLTHVAITYDAPLRGPLAVAYDLGSLANYDALYSPYIGTYQVEDGGLAAGDDAIWYAIQWTQTITDGATIPLGDIILDVMCGSAPGSFTGMPDELGSHPPYNDTPSAFNPLVKDPSKTTPGEYYCYGTEVFYFADLISWYNDSPSLNTVTFTYTLDADGDLWGAAAIPSNGGATAFAIDCADNDNTRYPGNTEIADNKDNDCDGQTDEGTVRYDDDGDCYCESATCNGSINPCGGGLNPAGKTDCDDTNINISPAAKDICGVATNEGGGGEDCDPDGPTYLDVNTLLAAGAVGRQLDEDDDDVLDADEIVTNGNDGPSDICKVDTDSDGLSDLVESAGGTSAATDRRDRDHDNDGIQDGDEVGMTGPLAGAPTEPGTASATDWDSDDDGLSDGQERGVTVGYNNATTSGTPNSAVTVLGSSSAFEADSHAASKTMATDADTDNDGLCDAPRVDNDGNAVINPSDACDDGPKASVGEDKNTDGEYDPGNIHALADSDDETNAAAQDSDSDGICDENGAPTGCVGSEFDYVPTLHQYGIRGWDSDSDDDGISDGAEDDNSNGVFESNESIPDNPDSDGDNLCDGLRPPGTVFPNDVAGGGDPGDTCDDSGTTPNEATEGTDRADSDTDNDGRLDRAEMDTAPFTCNRDTDHDDDGISDGAELTNTPATLPNNKDSDADLINDGTEIEVTSGIANNQTSGGVGVAFDGTGETVDVNGSLRCDNVTTNTFVADADTTVNPTDPTDPDTDGDGLCDGSGEGDSSCVAGEDNGAGGATANNGAITGNETNNLDFDHDDDGLSDGNEFSTLGTGNRNGDTDGDGLKDGTEMGIVLADIDTTPGPNPNGFTYVATNTGSANWVPDANDTQNTDPTVADSDDDGLCDGPNDVSGCEGGEDRVNAAGAAGANGQVDATESNPCDRDHDDDGILDGDEDLSGNGNGDETSFAATPLETNAISSDTDGDGLSDGREDGVRSDETTNTSVNSSADPDANVSCPGTNTGAGVTYDTDPSPGHAGSDPGDADSDGDGLCDGTTAVSSATFGSCADGEDQDADGLNADVTGNTESNPLDADHDNDGYADGAEGTGGLDKLLGDSDGDGLVDGIESNQSAVSGGTSRGGVTFAGTTGYSGCISGALCPVTDPGDPDTDEDGLCDGNGDVAACNPGEDTNNDGDIDTTETSPIDNDSEDDGLSDGAEATLGTNRLVADSDGDGLKDGTERGIVVEDVNQAPESGGTSTNGVAFTGTVTSSPNFVADADDTIDSDPNDPDTDNDGLCDGPGDVAACNPGEDKANFGATSSDETDPADCDSDDDGLCDGGTSSGQCNGRGEDANTDGVRQATETLPLNSDTDGDQLRDGEESGIKLSEALASGTSDGADADARVSFAGTNTAAGVDYDFDDDAGSDPADADSDGDGLCDGTEPVNNSFGNCADGEDANANGNNADITQPSGESDPLDADSDDDGLSDLDDVDGSKVVASGVTITYSALGKQDIDSDNDGLDDGVEVGASVDVSGGTSLGGKTFVGTAAAWGGDLDPPQTGGGGVAGTVVRTTNPVDPDSDNDGICDGPVASATGCVGGFVDGGEDATPNGRIDAGETDPRNPDTDTDGLSDGTEELEACNVGFTANSAQCTNPLDSDSDDDHVFDDDEMLAVCPGAADGTLTTPANCDATDNINALDQNDDNDLVLTTNEDYTIVGGNKGPGNNNPLDDNRDGDTQLDGSGNTVPIPDYLDTDDDGDTILTVTEDTVSDGTNTTGCATTANGNPLDNDVDGDTWPDYLDNDDDGNPNAKSDLDPAFRAAVGATGTQYTASTAAEIAAGTKHCIVDSDSDGVVDGTEFGLNPSAPRNTDGVAPIDARDDDDDDDGLLTVSEDNGTGLFNIDAVPFDNGVKQCGTDTIPNYLDRDSDNDGVCDGAASGSGCLAWQSVNRDGAGTTFPEQPGVDPDLDFVPSQWDCDDLDGGGVDSDLDGPKTAQEYGACLTPAGACPDDVDGVCGPTDPDCPTAQCCLNPYNADTDGDCVNDGDEMSLSFALIDSDADLTPDAFDRDDDEDHVPTYLEYYDLLNGEFQVDDNGVIRLDPLICDPTLINTGYIGPNDMDTDGDGVSDYLDTDDDGDGILTVLEAVDLDTDDALDDNDADGLPDYIDAVADGICGDLDGDGLNNAIEAALGLSEDTIDTDGDGIVDSLELFVSGVCAPPNVIPVEFDPLVCGVSFDEPCLNAAALAGGATSCCGAPLDHDSDGIVDALDDDDDNDGLDTKLEGSFDNDDDGVPNYLDDDSDGDAVADGDESLVDEDGDGIPEYLDGEVDTFGGPDEPPVGPPAPSCACTSVPTPISGLWSIVLGLGVLVRRRRAA